MSKTAYSKRYKKELDVEQLLSIKTGKPIEECALLIENIPDELRHFINEDAVCPSCGVSGAVLVKGAKSKVAKKAIRQAHFRFISQDGSDAHRPFCGHNTEDADQKIDGLVSFDSARTNETRFIRKLVCIGIEQSIFDQSDIRTMRQWYFDIKTETQYTLKTSPKIVEYASEATAWHPSSSIEHHPSHAEMPNFNWSNAAKSIYASVNKDLIKLLRETRVGLTKDRAIKLAERFNNRVVFDTSTLEPYYQKTIKLCDFVSQHLRFGDKKYFIPRGANNPPTLLAFCSLLLSVSEWDTDSAVEKLIKILKSPAPQDETLGNVIGLNPFHDYAAWKTLRMIDAVESGHSNDWNYDAQLTSIEQKIRNEHAEWRINTYGPELSPPQPKTATETDFDLF